MKPLVSVIIPCFNRIDELINAVNSIINQSYNNLEILIIDDYSTIDIKSSLNKINDKRIKYFKTIINGGVTESRKYGIEKSSGDLITFLDDDDYLTTNCLENKINLFLESPELTMVISDYTENNMVTKKIIYHSMEHFSLQFDRNICKNPGPFFQCCMFKKEQLFDYKILFDHNAIPSEDWDFFINLSKLNPIIGYINSPDFEWNFSMNSQSANFKNEANGLLYILKKHNDLFLKRVGNSKLSDHYRMVARVFEKDNDILNAKENYRIAFNINYLSIKNIFYMIISNFSNPIFKNILKYMRLIRKTPLG